MPSLYAKFSEKNVYNYFFHTPPPQGEFSYVVPYMYSFLKENIWGHLFTHLSPPNYDWEHCPFIIPSQAECLEQFI